LTILQRLQRIHEVFFTSFFGGENIKHAIEYKCVQYKKISIDMFWPPPYLSPSQRLPSLNLVLTVSFAEHTHVV